MLHHLAQAFILWGGWLSIKAIRQTLLDIAR